ncbi:MAG: 5-deoxy-glucuronate isomerase [Deltaproteobacteria bacterium]|nr:5-deoxy-glucuronate isomerase [Deltaproteobacteria bacterium]
MPQGDLLTSLRAGLQPGLNPILDHRSDPEVGLDVAVLSLAAGQSHRADSDGLETAWVALEGRGTLTVDGRSMAFDRPSWVESGPFVAHGPAGTRLEVRARTDCQLACLATPNEASFASRLYTPEQVADEHRGKGRWQDAAYRIVRTVFDGESAPPESRLVLGEVVNFPGRWSSYPPHHHAQPEIYYYRFWPEQGYGHGELGEAIHRLKQHDLLRVTRARDHAQVAAPGYYMYYLWAIRHLEGARYTGFEYAPEHSWLLKEEDEG